MGHELDEDAEYDEECECVGMIVITGSVPEVHDLRLVEQAS